MKLVLLLLVTAYVTFLQGVAVQSSNFKRDWEGDSIPVEKRHCSAKGGKCGGSYGRCCNNLICGWDRTSSHGYCENRASNTGVCTATMNGWCQSEKYPDECCYEAGFVCRATNFKSDEHRCQEHKEDVEPEKCLGKKDADCSSGAPCCARAGLVCKNGKCAKLCVAEVNGYCGHNSNWGTNYGKCCYGLECQLFDGQNWGRCRKPGFADKCDDNTDDYCGYYYPNTEYKNCCKRMGLKCSIPRGKTWGKCKIQGSCSKHQGAGCSAQSSCCAREGLQCNYESGEGVCQLPKHSWVHGTTGHGGGHGGGHGIGPGGQCHKSGDCRTGYLCLWNVCLPAYTGNSCSSHNAVCGWSGSSLSHQTAHPYCCHGYSCPLKHGVFTSRCRPSQHGDQEIHINYEQVPASP